MCAVLQDGTARCWGSNDKGQCGVGHDDDVHTPRQVLDIENVIYVSPGDRHTCGIVADNSWYCWGDDGKLGIDASEDTESPALVWAGYYYYFKYI